MSTKQCKCGSELFKIEERENCSTCIHNGAWDEQADNGDGDYTHDQKVIESRNLDRQQVEDYGECKIGTSHGEGCYMFTCASCGKQTNLPLGWD